MEINFTQFIAITLLIFTSCNSVKKEPVNVCNDKYNIIDLINDFNSSRDKMNLVKSGDFIYEIVGADLTKEWVSERYVFDEDSNLRTYEFFECCNKSELPLFGVEIKGGILCMDSLMLLGKPYDIIATKSSDQILLFVSFANPLFLDNIVTINKEAYGNIIIDSLKLTGVNSRPSYGVEKNDTMNFSFKSKYTLNGDVLKVDSASVSIPSGIRNY